MANNFIDNGLASTTGQALPGTKFPGPEPIVGPTNQYLSNVEANTITGSLADVKTVIVRQVSLMSFGADPTGVADSGGALASACAALSSGGILHIPVGTYLIGTNQTIPANVTLSFDSSILEIGTGVTLTINGTIDAAPQRIFSYTSGGANPVAFGTTPQSLNVKWFGAVGDGATDDSGAFTQACLSLGTLVGAIHGLPSPFSPNQGVPELIVPAGYYEINNTVELPGLASIRGDGQAQLQTSASIPILRIGALSKVLNICFNGGLHAIALYGGAVQNGGGFTPTDFGNVPIQIDRCSFIYQTGPSIWQDTSPATLVTSGSNGVTLPISGGVLNVGNTFGFPTSGQLLVFLANNNAQFLNYTGKSGTTFTGVTGGTGTLATGQLVQNANQARTAQSIIEVTNFYFAGPCLFWGAGDAVSFTNGHLSWDFTTCPTSTDGLPLGIFNGGCRISNVTGFGGGSQPARPAILVGTFWQVDNMRIGQNTEICFCRTKVLSNLYQGAAAEPVPLPTQGTATPTTLIVDECDLTACDGAFWLEIYENLPSQISMNQRLLAAPFDFENTFGIWVDQAVDLTQLRTLTQETHAYDFDYPYNGNEFRFYRGWDPGASVAPTKLIGVDITNQMINVLAKKDDNSAERQPNLFGTASATSNGGFTITSGGIGSPDTSSGFSLTAYTASATPNFGTAQFVSPNAFPTSLPAGVYCVSFYLKANFSAQVSLTAGETSDEGLVARNFDAADYVQRIEIPFYYPGNSTAFYLNLVVQPIPGVIAAWAGATVYAQGQQVEKGGNVYLAVVGGTSAGSGGPTGTGSGIVDNGVTWNYVGPGAAFTPTISLGLFMLNKGRKAAPYTFPQNADTALLPGWVPRDYYGTAAPTSTGDTYFVGDRVWNTAPSAGGVIGWVCTAAGSPGTWHSFGQVNMVG